MSDGAIVSGGIRGTKARVRREGQLETFATSVDEFENVSARDRNSFSWTIVPANFSAAETLLLLQNDNSDLHLHILDVEMMSDADTLVQIHLTDRAALTPANGTVVVGVCFNQTAPRVAEALARSNETANAQGNVIFNREVIANTPLHAEMHGAVILAKGQSIGVDITTGAAAIASCTIRGFYAIPDEDRT